jgi:sigma-B regulation protein RsbU (phosphoserine phosphatase)
VPAESRLDRVRLLALGLLFAASAAYEARHTAAVFEFVRSPQRVAGAPFAVGRASNEIVNVGKEAETAGLRPGDRLVALAGAAYDGREDLAQAAVGRSVGDRLALVVERGSERLETSVALVPLVESTPALALFLDVATPLLCLALGFFVVVLRRHDPRAWLLLLLMLSFSHFVAFSGFDVRRWEDGLRIPALFYRSLLRGLWPAAMLLFGVLFPERAGFDRRRPWLKWLLLGPVLLGALAGASVEALDATRYASAAGLAGLLRPIAPWILAIDMLAVGSFFACMGWRWGTETAPDARRRLALLLYGAGAGLTPIWLIFLYAIFFGGGGGRTIVTAWLLVPSFLLLGLFPITLAYVIVVEKAMDVRVIVRQGLQYALARRAILAMQVAVSALAVIVAVQIAGDPSQRRVDRVRYLALGVMFVALARRAGDGLRGFVDRRFFREAVDAERVLHDLSEEVRTIVDGGELLETVARRVSEALHAPRVAVLLARDGRLAPAHAVGYGAPPQATLAADGPVVSRLRDAKEGLRVYLQDAASWVNRDADAAAERPALEALRAELLLPLRLKQELVGVLCLGPKLSDEPYSASDVRLLRAVATQTAFALENSRLTAAVAAQVAKAARLDREIEIAHEVQEQLFPQDYPKVPGLDFAGHCRPAAGVGGDYYDFVSARPGRLGIAVGDVAGKGIPAALLMAGLQASLRGQALNADGDLVKLMDHVNRLVCDASPANRYATFFYGEYQAESRRFAYVNAGHNAPFLRRASGAVERLEGGGPVVGLLYPAGYSQHETRLEPGDLLVGYTDGISEAMNAADEEWGEERLLAAIEACDGKSARETIDALMRDADAFVAGAKQHDDMTIVVVRAL